MIFLFKIFKKVFKWFFIVSALVFIIAVFLALKSPVLEPKSWGVTYSAFYAEQFGLDGKEVYLALFDDLGVKKLRLPAYWNEIEGRQGEYNFSNLDWQLEEAQKRDVDVILAVGKKLPRWPECHMPVWAWQLPQSEQDKLILEYIKKVVQRYKNYSAIAMWQVENEPFLPFGRCATIKSGFLDKEIGAVRALDNRPILVTDSGELSVWVRAARRSDIFGTTMYRKVRNKIFGQMTYPLPPGFFRAKRTLTELITGKRPMIVIELQAEPWLKKMTYEASVEEQYAVMNPDELKGMLSYAKRSGFDTFYLWGVEWWYWLKTQGHPEMWNIVKREINAI